MKVNMNDVPENSGQAPKIPKPDTRKPSGKPAKETAEDKKESSGNVYVESLNMYKERYREKFRQSTLLETNKFWIILCVVLFFVFISINSNVSRTKNQLTVQLKRTTVEIDRLTTATDEVKQDLEEQARIDSMLLTEEEEELARNDAKVQGNQAAYLQNKFRTIVMPDQPEQGDFDSESDYNEAFAKYKEKYDKYATEMNKVKDDLDGLFADDCKRIGKGAWYAYYEQGIPGNWEFASNASFKGDTGKVLWFLYADNPKKPNDHSLLAYATAVYNVSTKKFSNLDIKTTSYAEANNKGDDASPVNADESSLVEQMKNLANGELSPVTPSADEDFDQETIDTNNDISDSRNSYKQSVANGEVIGEEYDNRYNIGLGNRDTEESEDSEEDSEEESEGSESGSDSE